MLKLIGYEFRKTWFAKVVLLCITALLELVFVIGLLTSDENTIILSAMLLALVATGGVMAMGLISVTILHRDMNTRQGYMLFMTPNSCYKILGAKVLENGLTILVTGVFFALLGALDITLLFGHYKMIDRLWELLTSFMTQMVPQLNLQGHVIFLFLISSLCSWVLTVLTAFFADVMASSVLRGKRGGGFVAFLIFLAINLLKGWGGMKLGETNLFSSLESMFIWTSVIDLALAALMYWVTALVMERRLSV